jgi:hypothetical protein
MKKETYAENRKKHLQKYAKVFPIGAIGGCFKGNYGYKHILSYPNSKNNKENKRNKYGVVCKYNILEGIDTTLFNIKDMHRFAHHLNSSQVLCYNFFRPLITNDGNPQNKLIELLNSWGIIITNDAKCSFEYNDNKGDSTQFDFHIKCGEIEIFFEIKYTEYGFGKADDDDKHKEKFRNVYQNLLDVQKCLKNKPTDCTTFVKDYQLYRNALRITGKDKYLILLYPKGNTHADKEAIEFMKNIEDCYNDNIKRIHWEDINIIRKNNELYRKYFAE